MVGATMKVSKLDAARFQLATAIDLWQNDADPVSAHSLAYSAYQVIHDLNRKAKGPPLLLDAQNVKPEDTQSFVNEVKFFSNFFKHADDRRKAKKKPEPDEVEFNPLVNEIFLAFCVKGLKYLKQQPTAQEQAFESWFSIENPHVLTPEAKAMYEDMFGTQAIAGVRGLGKKQFFELLKKLAADSGVFSKTRY
jgi:hypothetical protein